MSETTGRTAVPEPSPADDGSGPGPGDDAMLVPREGRFQSARRVPAALTALVILVVTLALLYDVAAVRAGRPAMAWRRRLARELASRPLDEAWIVGGALVAVLLGLWLLVLAVTPGERGMLVMRQGPGGVRAGQDRQVAAFALRDRAVDVPGVRTARVEVGRHRVVARVGVHFRELDEVRADLEDTLTEGISLLGLQRPLRLTVRVHRAEKG